MEYCKKVKSFSLLKTFKNEKYKIVNYVLQHNDNHPKVDEDFLFTFRFLDGEWIPTAIFEELVLPFVKRKGDLKKIRTFFESEEAKNEALEIRKNLIKKRFIRSDNINKPLFLAAMISEKPVDFYDIYGSIGDKELFKKSYERLKPASEINISEILDIAKNKLSQEQYEILEFAYFEVGWKHSYDDETIALLESSNDVIRSFHDEIYAKIYSQ